MNLSGLLPYLRRLPAYNALVAQLESGAPAPMSPHSLLQSARPFVTAGLKMQRGSALLLVTARSEMAQQWQMQLETWLPAPEEGGPRVYHFVEPDALPYERIHWTSVTRQQRLTALAALQNRSAETPPVIVTSARGLMQKTLPARELRMALRPVRVGDMIRLEQMTQNWVQTGYAPTDVVEEPGVFARRGGIIDIWPPNLPQPVRIDLFGDEVESLRVFDPTTQRTVRMVDSIQIGPGSEALSKYGPAALERLGIHGERLLDPRNISGEAVTSVLQDPNLLLAVREELRLEVEQLAQGLSFHGIEWYLPYFYERPTSLLDHAPADATIVVDDALDLLATLQELELQAASLREELERSGELPRGFASSYFTTEELRAQLLARNPVLLGYGALDGKATSANTPLARSFVPAPRYNGKTRQIAQEAQKLREQDHCVVLASRQAARLQATLREEDIIVHVQSDLLQPPPPRSVILVQGVLGEGFIMRGLEGGPSLAGATNGASKTTSSPDGTFDLHLLTDTELYGWSKPQARRRPTPHSKVAAEIFFADVKPGDYVVHLEHGVGIFDGLVKLKVGEIEREYLQVSYARNDKLYVPVHQAERLSRYVGAGEKTPAVNRLGTADWNTVKERTRKAVIEIAEDLLKLYAERELVRGHAFSPDGAWHEELADSFPYEETDDQLVAIEAVRQDMESDKPMDRLICGDVGYGKTEVAVRAAFKAIADGKQVAVLVPTTVLAQQHYRTMSNRLSRFPVRVDVLSRFRTDAQQQQTIHGLKQGTVDLVVGTHRLLSEDVEFKDLGLLIIDEEQRFGVVQKERLKQLRTQVDVLTLSATPIPRTLHMSLSGVRDMSTINTPPKERLPIHTVLAENDDVLIKQAIQRELARKGQVFVVTDRVRGIQMLADRIQRLVPEASVAVGHGQMPERQLEDIMLQFADGEYDVLVATTIIENGLDIPNANTIIINRAEHFGLAQLYQLRGRVGRSAQRGYCYLLHDKHVPLSFDARRRLSAIMESSEELGAGFRIAMRDLEIRGAGELLGSRQSGNIDSVGFDLYTRLLAQAINEVRRKMTRFAQAERLRQPEDQAATNGDAQLPLDQSDQVETDRERRQEGELAAGGFEIEEGESQPRRGQGTGSSTPLDAYLSDTEAPFDINDPLTPPVQLDLPIDARIPQTYIEDDALRLQMYRRIAGITHFESLDEMRKELLDRFGGDPATDTGADVELLPEEVENLLYQIRVKLLAIRANVQNIGREMEHIAIRSEALENMNRASLQARLLQEYGLRPNANVSHDEMPRVSRRAVYLPIDPEQKWRSALIRILEIMAYS